MTVRDVNGMVVSSDPIEMKAPHDIPKQAGWIELGDIDIDGIEFPTSLIDPYVIEGQSNLSNITKLLPDIMNNENKEVEVKTWDGSWVGKVYLPESSTIPAGSKVQLTCSSSYSVHVYY